MRLKRVGRFGTIGALVAAALGTSVVLAPSSASAASEWRCHGTAVKRCATVWYNSTDRTFRARARITDVDGGGNYQVRVTNVKLQRYRPSDGRWVTVRQADDHDGWHATRDLARTSTIDPCRPQAPFRVRATFSWKGAASGQETWGPGTAWTSACH